ncbi:MAG: hypothetical protein Kow0059_01140 [Candidatus Sumerlaeia bacterium]
MVLLRLTDPLGGVKELSFDKPTITIGRHPSNDVVLDDELVSRFHAELEADDARLVILDLGSRNGVFVNEDKVLEAPLQDGDEVRIGKVKIKVIRRREARDDSSAIVTLGGPRSGESRFDQTREKKLEVRTRYSSGIEWARMGPDEIFQWRNYIQFQMHLSDALLRALDFDSFMRQVLDFLHKIIPYNRAAYLSFDADSGRLEPRFITRSDSIAPGAAQEHVFPVSLTIAEESLRGEKIITCSNAMADSRFADADSVALLGLRCVLCIPLVGRERPLGVIHMDSDRAELVRTEEDINFLNLISHFIAMAIENYALREERTDREKSTAVARTLSVLSENLKARLMILKGKFSLLETRMLEHTDERERILFGDLKTDFEQLTRLLDGMIGYTRGRQITFQEVHPNEFLLEFVRRLNVELRERGIELHVGLDKTLPVCWLDLEGIELCLEYLCRNAIEALDDQQSPEITIATEFDENNFIIMVQDNGPGMSQATVARIFQPFYTTKGRNHVGLGLTFARKLAEEMGGRIEVQSEPDYGSTFSLVLPRRLPSD